MELRKNVTVGGRNTRKMSIREKKFQIGRNDQQCQMQLRSSKIKVERVLSITTRNLLQTWKRSSHENMGGGRIGVDFGGSGKKNKYTSRSRRVKNLKIPTAGR